MLVFDSCFFIKLNCIKKRKITCIGYSNIVLATKTLKTLFSKQMFFKKLFSLKFSEFTKLRMVKDFDQ